MAKTVADYEAEGAAAHANGTVLPFTEAKSWQQKATLAGWVKARDAHLASMDAKKTVTPSAVLEHLDHLRSELVKSSAERKARIEAKIAKLQVKWGL